MNQFIGGIIIKFILAQVVAGIKQAFQLRDKE